MDKARQHRFEREKLVWRYANALEQGDFETITWILQEAEADPVLEQMILEINDGLIEEDELVTPSSDVELVHKLILTHLPSAVSDDSEELELPPLTVAQVVSELQKEPQLWRQNQREDATALEHLKRSQEPLPEQLTERGVRQLFERVRLSVSDRFQELFRETAIFLSLGREQDIARLAATRKQREARKKGSKSGKRDD